MGAHMKTVLIAMHYQNEVLHPHGKIRVGVAAEDANRQAVKDNATRLLAAARNFGIPVISVRIAFRPDHADVIQNCRIFRDLVANKAMIEGSWGAEFHEGLGPVGDELVVKHSRVNAFYGSQLEELLRVLKAERLVMAGIATNSVVETSVRHASDMGYAVVVAADACSSGRAELHEASLENMRYVADVKTVAEILGEMSGWANASARQGDSVFFSK
jgi:nicotinamidase-related amidase